MNETSNNSRLPAWIQSMLGQDKVARANHAIEFERGENAALIIQAEGPQFWRSFTSELAHQVSFMPYLGAQGTSHVTGEPTSESTCQVSVSLTNSSRPGTAAMSFCYSPGQPEIRSHGQSIHAAGEDMDLTFQVQHGKVFAVGKSSVPLAPEELAMVVVKELLDTAKRAAQTP